MNLVCSFILKGWSFTKRMNYLIIPTEKGAGYAPNWTGNRLLQDDRMRTLQEMEEW